MDKAKPEDERWMRRALELAVGGRGRVEPNPMVGAVIVKDGRVIGEGFHRKFGEAHAEINAMAAAGEACRGATLYVTLSPCSARDKKTPPCTDAVVAAGFARVVVGTVDATQPPALDMLRAARIEVTEGVLRAECERLIAPFMKLKTRGMPWTIAKWAMTADGKIATASGDSKWISCEESRRLVHQWRGEVDAVLIGRGTAEADDPLLTCRAPGGRNPARIVLAGKAHLLLESQLVKTASEAPVIVACSRSANASAVERLRKAGCEVLPLPSVERGVDIEALLRELGARQFTNVLVEGGAEVLGDFFDRRMVDEVRVFIAPRVFGGKGAASPVGGAGVETVAEALSLAEPSMERLGQDILLRGYVQE